MLKEKDIEERRLRKVYSEFIKEIEKRENLKNVQYANLNYLLLLNFFIDKIELNLDLIHIAKNARKRVSENFTWKAIAQKQYQVYKELLSQGK